MNWIVEKSTPLNDRIAQAEEEIRLMREYRDPLISDVVTGQVDVRGRTPGPHDVTRLKLICARECTRSNLINARRSVV